MLRRDVTAQAESTIDGVYHQRASGCLDRAEKCGDTTRENFVELTRIAAVATALHAHAHAIAGDEPAHLRRRQKYALGEALDLHEAEARAVRADDAFHRVAVGGFASRILQLTVLMVLRNLRDPPARVAELVDALVSGTSG